MQKNKDDFRELAEEVCKLLVMLRDRVRHHQSSIALSPEFSQLCMEFVQCLLNIQSQMNEVMRQQSVRLRGYFKASVVRNLLMRYKVQMGTLRLNFMMLNVFDIRVQIADIRSLLDAHNPSPITNQQLTRHVMAEGDMLGYRQINIGDLRVLTEPLARGRGTYEDIAAYTEEFLVQAGEAKKTLRIYHGSKPLHTLRNDFNIVYKFRHPYIVQLFGVCSSRHSPGLIFHGELTSCTEYIQALDPLQAIAFSFRMYRQWQSACQYLSKHESFGQRFTHEMSNVYLEGLFDDCHWYTYLNEIKDLQISVEHPVPRQDNVVARTYQYSHVPPITPSHMATIETVLAHGVLPTNADKRSSLLAFYKSMLTEAEWGYQLEDLNSSRASWPRHIFVNPIGNLRGGRLAFKERNSFKWHFTKWDDSDHDCPLHKVGDWSRFTIPSTSSPKMPTACRYAWGKFFSNETAERYMWVWLSQAESLRRQIREQECILDDNILIGRQIEFELTFQSAFPRCSFRPDVQVVYLFIKDLDTNGGTQVFWSVNPEGCDRLSPTEETLYGLQKPVMSLELLAAHWSSNYYHALRVFHQVCGLIPSSNDAARFLKLPMARFEANKRTLRKRRSDNCFSSKHTLDRIGRTVQWKNDTFVWTRRRSSFSARHDVCVEPWRWYEKLWGSPQCWLD
ncbi:hypothetical protein APHAL10511_002418 [Amanita phalloides]|nr:hypothetical protein APHAL10511_002418 [Amanita phalloides]